MVVGEVSLLDHGERDLVLSGWSGANVGAPVGVAPQLLAAAVAAVARMRWRSSTVRGGCHIASWMRGRRGWRGC